MVDLGLFLGLEIFFDPEVFLGPGSLPVGKEILYDNVPMGCT